MRVAIIPARGGSRRIPRKNIRNFHGKPIIRYSIEAAISTRLFDRVVVTTDDAEIAQVAMSAGAWAIWRKRGLEADQIGTQEVATQTIGLFTPTAEYACVIYATSPLMDSHDIYRGWAVMRDNDQLHYAFAVNAEPLFDAGQFYWARAKALIERKPLIEANTALVPIPPQRVCDINTEDDWIRAERMYAALKEKEAA